MDKKQFEKKPEIPPVVINSNGFDPIAALIKYKVDISQQIEKPRVILSAYQNSPLATIGNFSLIIGKAKTKKTFLITSMAAAAIGKHCPISCINGDLSDMDVVLVDTEQAPYHLHRTVDRILRQTGNAIPENFTAYGLRPLAPSQRVQVVGSIIDKLNRPALIIIDGLRDLLTRGINDETEATEITSKILRWTYEKDCHIMLVLHQNKNDFNARGHVGTEAVNKAETVLSVERDERNRDISIVTAVHCRDIDFPPFYFRIDENGLPVEANQVEASQNHKAVQMSENFAFILPGIQSKTYTELCKEYQETAGVSEPTAKRHIGQALKSNMLKKDKIGSYYMIHQEEEAVPF